MTSRSGGMVDTRDLKSLAHCERVGSSPTFGTHAEVAQLVEHNLAKVGVASSSLVFRSAKKKRMMKHHPLFLSYNLLSL